MNYRASLYYIDPLAPAEQSDTVPEGAELIKSVIVKANGPETVLTASAGAAPKDGFYTWVWEVKADDQDAEWSKYIKADFVDDYGMADETTSVRHPAQIDSKLSVRDTKAGTYLVDDVFVTGMPSDHPNFEGAAGFKADEKLISHEVLFFPAGLKVTEANRDKAEKIGQTVTIAAKNGVYPSVGDTSWIAKKGADGKLVAGTYVFISTFAGDDRVTPLATSVEDVTEQFTITADSPKLKTTFTGENGEKTLKPGKDTKLVDKVCDANEKLVPGTEYTLRLKVHNKTTGKMVMVDGTEYEATAKFTPNTPQDCGKVVANLDTTGMANTQLVAFEYVYDANGQLVGTHADAGDADQTIKLAAADNSGGGSALAKTGANLAPLGVAALLATGGAGALVAKRRKN